MRVNLLNLKCSIFISNFARLDNKLSKFEEFCLARKVVAIWLLQNSGVRFSSKNTEQNFCQLCTRLLGRPFLPKEQIFDFFRSNEKSQIFFPLGKRLFLEEWYLFIFAKSHSKYQFKSPAPLSPKRCLKHPHWTAVFVN